MDFVQRHTFTVRVTHWLIAISGILLLFSGLGQMPMAKRYNIVKLPGLAWTSNYEITLLIHYLAAAVFTALVVFHLFYHLRRREFGIMPKRGDIGEAVQGFLEMFGIGKKLHHEKFQAKQRIIYGVIGFTSLLLIGTGLIKSYKNLGAIIVDPMLLQWVAFIHTGTGMFFLLLLFAHVAALLLKSHRPLIPSMITGRLDAEYARVHHSKWQTDKK